MLRYASLIFMVSCVIVVGYLVFGKAHTSIESQDQVVEKLLARTQEESPKLVREGLWIGVPAGVAARVSDDQGRIAEVGDAIERNDIPLSDIVPDSLDTSLRWISVKQPKGEYALAVQGAHQESLIVSFNDVPHELIQLNAHDPARAYSYSLVFDAQQSLVVQPQN